LIIHAALHTTNHFFSCDKTLFYNLKNSTKNQINGGESGIRTHDTIARIHAFNHTYQYYIAQNRALVALKKHEKVYNNYVIWGNNEKKSYKKS